VARLQAVFSAQSQVVFLVTSQDVDSKVLLSAVPSAQELVLFSGILKTKRTATNCLFYTSQKTARPQTLRFFCFRNLSRNALLL
jgi:hypothetical protein